MTRLNLILFTVLMVLALGTVTAQHRARQLFGDWEEEKEVAQRYETEWRQLQTEQSTWAVDSRVEAIASGQLHMRTPEAKSVQVVMLAKNDAPRQSDAIDTLSMQVQDIAQTHGHENEISKQNVTNTLRHTPTQPSSSTNTQARGVTQ